MYVFYIYTRTQRRTFRTEPWSLTTANSSWRRVRPRYLAGTRRRTRRTEAGRGSTTTRRVNSMRFTYSAGPTSPCRHSSPGSLMTLEWRLILCHSRFCQLIVYPLIVHENSLVKDWCSKSRTTKFRCLYKSGVENIDHNIWITGWISEGVVFVIMFQSYVSIFFVSVLCYNIHSHSLEQVYLQ